MKNQDIIIMIAVFCAIIVTLVIIHLEFKYAKNHREKQKKNDQSFVRNVGKLVVTINLVDDSSHKRVYYGFAHYHLFDYTKTGEIHITRGRKYFNDDLKYHCERNVFRISSDLYVPFSQIKEFICIEESHETSRIGTNEYDHE